MEQTKQYVDSRQIPISVQLFAKRYSKREEYAVKDITFAVHKGEFHGFIGANGAGKTTIIKSLIGAYAKFEGKVEIFGVRNSRPESKGVIGYIPEAANFPKGFSAYSYIKQMSLLSGMSAREAKEETINQMKAIGIWDIRNKAPHKMSSGQKKKVLLAQALVHKPSILIMDEPAANLDPQARVEFFETLLELKKKGLTIFISSHILAELDRFVDAVTIIDGGKIAYTGKTAEITKNPNLKYAIVGKDIVKVKAYIEKLGLKSSLDKNHSHTLVANLLSMDNVYKLMSQISKQKWEINSVTEDKKTLEQIYREFVQFGSVHTKGNDIKGREVKHD